MSDDARPRHCHLPSACSVCLGVAPKLVVLVDGITYIDGEPVSSSSETAAAMPQPKGTKHRYGRRAK